MRFKKFNYFLAVLATIMFTGAYAQQTAKVTPSGIGYLEYLPQGYNTNSNNYPVVISLHGIGEKGTTSTDPAVIKESAWKAANVSLAKYIKYGQQYPFIVISPQLKSSYGTWPANYVMEVLNYVKQTLRIDPRRVYLTGLSLGGFGVWTTAGAYPEQFAAIAPICAGGNSLAKACNIASENVAVWGFHGDADGTVSYQVTLKMVNAINACATKPNPLAKITIYPGLRHVIWDKVYKETNVLNWMLTFTNGSVPSTPTPSPAPAPANVAPVVSAGSDKNITLPTNSTYMQGTASDSDGSIASYAWTKISGGTVSMSGTTTSKLSVSNLVAGSYTFRLTVKDNKGLAKYDDVRVNVASSTTSTSNIVQAVSAGSDRTLSLPSNWTYLPGSASDPDGIASYTWTKVSGAYAKMEFANSSRLRAGNLTAGTYTFRLTVKDKKGAVRYDDVKVIVKS